MGLDTGEGCQLPGVDTVKSAADADGSDYSRRDLLRIGRNMGVLLLAACSGASPFLREKNLFAEKLNKEEMAALELIYSTWREIDKFIAELARRIGKMRDVNKMIIEEADVLETIIREFDRAFQKTLSKYNELIAALKLRYRGQHFREAVDHFDKTVAKKTFETYRALVNPAIEGAETVYMQYIATLTDDNFEREVLKSGDVYIVMVSAEWCSACHNAMPLTAKFGRKSTKGVKIGRAVLEDAKGNIVNPKIREFFKDNTRGFPVYIVFIKGQPVGGMLGKPDSLEYFDWLLSTAQREYRERYEPGIPPPQIEPDDVGPGITPIGDPLIEI